MGWPVNGLEEIRFFYNRMLLAADCGTKNPYQQQADTDFNYGLGIFRHISMPLKKSQSGILYSWI